MNIVKIKELTSKYHLAVISVLIILLLISVFTKPEPNQEVVSKVESRQYGFVYTDTTGYRLKTYCIDGVKYVYRAEGEGQFFSIMFNSDSTVKLCNNSQD